MKQFVYKYWDILLAGCLSFIAPIVGLLMATGTLVICDMITGVIAAKKRGEEIHSKKMGATVTKTILYFIGIILAHIMEHFFWPGTNISKSVAGIFALIEFKSNLENISSATGIDLVEKLKAFIDNKRGVK